MSKKPKDHEEVEQIALNQINLCEIDSGQESQVKLQNFNFSIGLINSLIFHQYILAFGPSKLISSPDSIPQQLKIFALKLSQEIVQCSSNAYIKHLEKYFKLLKKCAQIDSQDQEPLNISQNQCIRIFFTANLQNIRNIYKHICNLERLSIFCRQVSSNIAVSLKSNHDVTQALKNQFLQQMAEKVGTLPLCLFLVSRFLILQGYSWRSFSSIINKANWIHQLGQLPSTYFTQSQSKLKLGQFLLNKIYEKSQTEINPQYKSEIFLKKYINSVFNSLTRSIENLKK